MIILRYLLKEVLVTTLVISLVIFLISFGSRFAQYLDEAWRGSIAADVLFTILGFRIPEFLMLNLPISFFIAILLSYGRLYVDNEMVVLSSCGVSKRRLLFYSLIPAAFIASVVAFLTLKLGPTGLARANEIQIQQDERSELGLLVPKRLQSFSQGGSEVYFERFAGPNRQKIENVFIAEMSNPEAESDRVSVLTARTGEEYIDPETGQRFLELQDVYRYNGKPGSPDYLVDRFASFRYLFETEPSRRRSARRESLPTRALLESGHHTYKAELQWRLSLPLVVLIATLIAVPMSYTNPRQGRFFKLFPALLLITLYIGLLSVAKSKTDDGDIPPTIGLWWVHGLYLLIALVLLWWNNGQYRGQWRRSVLKSHLDKATASPELKSSVDAEGGGDSA